MSLDALRESLPAYAKDLSLNLSSLAAVCASSESPWALASALTARITGPEPRA